METTATTTRKNIEMQGYPGFDDAEISRLDVWLRFAPALCMAWAAAATIAGSAAAFFALVPFAAFGAVLRNHPFEWIYNLGLRHPLGHPPLPPTGTPRRWACAMASVHLFGTGVAFASGTTTLGTVLGAIMVATAAVPVTTGFCIPSYFHGLITKRPIEA